MLMQNFGVTNKEYYGMLWHFLEWSIAPSTARQVGTSCMVNYNVPNINNIKNIRIMYLTQLYYTKHTYTTLYTTILSILYPAILHHTHPYYTTHVYTPILHYTELHYALIYTNRVIVVI